MENTRKCFIAGVYSPLFCFIAGVYLPVFCFIAGVYLILWEQWIFIQYEYILQTFCPCALFYLKEFYNQHPSI